jgi:hypothetical protein
VMVCGLCLTVIGRVAVNGQGELDRARMLRAVALVVIVASCIVHYALLAFY